MDLYKCANLPRKVTPANYNRVFLTKCFGGGGGELLLGTESDGKEGLTRGWSQIREDLEKLSTEAKNLSTGKLQQILVL